MSLMSLLSLLSLIFLMALSCGTGGAGTEFPAEDGQEQRDAHLSSEFTLLRMLQHPDPPCPQSHHEVQAGTRKRAQGVGIGIYFVACQWGVLTAGNAEPGSSANTAQALTLPA